MAHLRQIPPLPFVATIPKFVAPFWTSQGRWDKILTVLLALVIFGVIGTLGYMIATPKGEPFTEFYILGLYDKAGWYPEEFILNNGEVAKVTYFGPNGDSKEIKGDSGKVTLGVVNHEQETTTYTVKLTIDDKPSQIWLEEDGEWHDELIFSLNNDKEWEQKIGFTPKYICVSTTLADTAHEKDTGIRVVSAEGFAVGNILQLGDVGIEGKEYIQIKAIEGDTITLEKELRHDHAAATRLVKPQKVEFLLYKGASTEPYQRLHLWIDVKEAV